MPAITVSDPLTLPVVTEPNAETSPERRVVSVTTAPSGFEGEGFPVRRAFAGVPQHLLDPFVHMDQMGEVEYAPGEPKGTPWHPHRGFETVTYMIDGTFQHHDSTGGGGLITDGDTQWMTAGSGLLHIERPPDDLVASGGLFHGVQLWVNLPAADKFVDPRYQDIRGGQVKLLRSPDGGARAAADRRHPRRLRGPRRDPHPDHLRPRHGRPRRPAGRAVGARLQRPGLRPRRSGHRGAAGQPVRTGQLAVFGPGGHLTLAADADQDSHTPNLEVLLLGGRPIREPVAQYGPFVMNTRAELAQAVEDFQAGKMGQIPADHVGS